MENNISIRLQDLLKSLEEWAPLAWQEDYDNSGLILGNPSQMIRSVLICFDLNLEIVEEAIEKDCNLIISHHPPIFKGLKKIDIQTPFGKMLQLSMQHGIAWYSMHTNLDNSSLGVNSYLCRKLDLQDPRPLVPLKERYEKLEVYVPDRYANSLLVALNAAGCGNYPRYDSCSWSCEGVGQFRALENARPFVGQKGCLHRENETKIECVFPVCKRTQVLQTMMENHPYEEIGFNLVPIANESRQEGAGVIGRLKNPMEEKQFLDLLRAFVGNNPIRHSGFLSRQIRTVALCGGSGAAFIRNACSQKADVYITADLKYHDFTETPRCTWLVDIGHYESEHFAKELIHDHITKNFPNFAVHFAVRSVNPVFYY